MTILEDMRNQMTTGKRARIVFGRPDIDQIRKEGYSAVDMHVHTCHSDAAPGIPQILEYARQYGFGIAITDHNEIRGVLEAEGSLSDILVIPGIELDCAEGPHILLYFYSHQDLGDFYEHHIRDKRRGAQYMTAYPAAEYILSAAEGYSCLKIAAHPFGYFWLNRGILKCDAKNMLPGIRGRLDGIEAICGGMSRRVNTLAADYANRCSLPVTGGSDAHILSDIGSVITGVRADTIEEFLQGILRKECIVTGSSSGIVSRGMTAGVIAYNYVPYSVTALHTRIGPHTARLRHSMKRFFR
jgi:predicted metal-dependent phosphoesterase TrpH